MRGPLGGDGRAQPLDKPLTFRAALYTIGPNRCVDVPARVSAALPADPSVAVIGQAGGLPIRTTLMPRGKGRHRLFIHSRVWRALGLKVGDRIGVTLALDPDAEEVLVPADILAALGRRPGARAAFLAWPPASQRQLVRYVKEARRADTRRRRIRGAVALLAELGRRRAAATLS